MNIENIIDKEAIKNIKKDFMNFIKMAVVFTIVLYIYEITLGTVCYWQVLFNIPCPFCNITTAFLEFISFNFKKSFQTHPLLPLVFLNVFICFFSKYTKYKKIFYILLVISGILFILFYITRYFI